MTRTKLCDRILPDYTRGEEKFNMVSHIVGAAFGVVALTLCVVFSALKSDAWAVVSSAIYGVSLILLYTMSSVYHGLPLSSPTAKKVMQIMDHCTIYALICGSYTPVLLCSIRRVSPGWGWGLFGVVFGLCRRRRRDFGPGTRRRCQQPCRQRRVSYVSGEFHLTVSCRGISSRSGP